jgi:mono/diheme cytochrome c family protein
MSERLARRSLRIVAAITPLLALSLALMLSACSERVGQGWDWKRMRLQRRYDAFGANAMFADGSAMRAPPVGTVARETLPTGMRPQTDLVRGASRYHIFCAVCHGERGDGVSIVASDMDDPKPPSLVASPARDLAPDKLFETITTGVGRMPPFASQLSAADRWQVIAYLAELQRRATGALTDSAARTPAGTEQ